ncbi:hypothetical protein GCM10025859_42310 [Alicyclobacillus fastidiosus]|nr:hypothetical protein GCM10025859_42310 [Alicyclobacillus fastidiosus]
MSDYSPALGEVSGLYLIRVDDMQNICRRKTDVALIRGFGIDDQGRHGERAINIRLGDMIEYEISYYEMLFRHFEAL